MVHSWGANLSLVTGNANIKKEFDNLTS